MKYEDITEKQGEELPLSFTPRFPTYLGDTQEQKE